MKNPPAIRLLASTNNERGDLFTRLTKDLFFALGYDHLRLDIHKTGREIDIQGQHRHEMRCVVAECKAHAKPMGGSDLNKLRGVLDVERERCKPTPVTGYFVSLSGFTETAIEQEKEAGDLRVCLIDGKQVVVELQKSRVLVEHAVAAEQAGRCAEHNGLQNQVIDSAELLGDKRGYIWAIYYSHGKKRTHFALIHADGTPLAASVAQKVIDADKECDGTLHLLTYLAPPAPPPPDRATLKVTALARYREWLANECGYIQLDGLPADTDLSATRLKLEHLFVPLKASFLKEREHSRDVEPQDTQEIHSIGEILEKHPHLALLAAPGGGKSTLLKRLAVAYGCPDRLAEVDDSLPKRDWLPLFVRCRALRDRASRPILELLGDLPQHAGMNGDEAAAFGESIHESLRDGRALLLVDGLDEISNEGDRQVFAQHLRTFVGMFPQVSLVVTSREAGFRQVAGVVASTCTGAKLAPFDEGDVLKLCEEWSVHVIGDTDEVRTQARKLAKTIWDNERIRALAENPLLLTTLLVLKRTIRELPRSRAELYREAARVLIRTWNVEGYEPLDEDEALTQLSYVACSMMAHGIQQIGHKSLLKLLRDARKELEAELQFAQLSPTEFIERIEYRSSLLIQTGHEEVDGELQPLYEFRHLTFQEYLAARGYVEEQYPGRDEGKQLADLLEPHFEDENWREVIPLAAVLAKRNAEETIKRLTTASEQIAVEERLEPVVGLLRQCLLDEVQVSAETLRTALLESVRVRKIVVSGYSVELEDLLRSKFGALLQKLVESRYLSGAGNWDQYESPFCDLVRIAHSELRPELQSVDSIQGFGRSLVSDDRAERIRAAAACMWLSFWAIAKGSEETVQTYLEQFDPISDSLFAMLGPDDEPAALMASQALVWVGTWRLRVAPLPTPSVLSLFRLWRDASSTALATSAADALCTQPTLPRESFEAGGWGDCSEFLHQAVKNKDRAGSSGVTAALVIGWYRHQPWNDKELAERISLEYKSYGVATGTAREMLAELGEPGKRVLEKWDQECRERTESPPGAY